MRQRTWGGRLILTADAGPLLLHPDRRDQTVIVLSSTANVAGIHRHWNDEIKGTQVCKCEPRCPSHRIDRFAAGLLKVSPDSWEERVLVITEQAWVGLERFTFTLTKGNEVRGAMFRWLRTGDKSNGRVSICNFQVVPEVPLAFDVAPILLRHLGIATDFFGIEDMPPSAEPPAFEELPAELPKPRVPKGKRK